MLFPVKLVNSQVVPNLLALNKENFSQFQQIFIRKSMEPEKQKALVIDEYGKAPTVKQVDVPTLSAGQVLVKMDGTTVNPSDRLLLDGLQFNRTLPAIAGIEGSGRVVKAEGEEVQKWVGKRVSFLTSNTGTWTSYVATNPFLMFEIDEDVPFQSAVSGVVNPLTVIGMVEMLKEKKLKGIVHSAAASSLGRMLNKLCIKEGVPLLNIVRKEEHEKLLKSEGAEHVIVTQGDWQAKYKEQITKTGYNCLFDALGGGPVTKTLIEELPMEAGIHIYGVLEGKPLIFDKVGKLLFGQKIEGYVLMLWWAKTSEQVKNNVRANYSKYLKNELKTSTAKELTFNEFEEALEISIKKTAEGKVLMKPL